jgi:hypothetical protein
VLEEKLAKDSASLNSKSKEKELAVVGTVVNAVVTTTFLVVPTYAEITLLGSVEPGPDVILNFAPVYALLTELKLDPSVILVELAETTFPVIDPILVSNKNVL